MAKESLEKAIIEAGRGHGSEWLFPAFIFYNLSNGVLIRLLLRSLLPLQTDLRFRTW
jgi:hypothetical protein